MKAQWLNGWTRETFLKQIEKMNGFTVCLDGDSNHCMYRNNDGKACLVGAFIPDDNYSVRFDTGDLTSEKLLKLKPELKEFMPLAPKLMRDLQIRHDFKFETFGKNRKEINKQIVITFLDEHGLE